MTFHRFCTQSYRRIHFTTAETRNFFDISPFLKIVICE